MKEKIKKTLRRTFWALVMIAASVGVYFEAGPLTALLAFVFWVNIIKLADVIRLQNEVLERVKGAMLGLGTLLVDKTLRDAAEDAAEEADREDTKGTEPTESSK